MKMAFVVSYNGLTDRDIKYIYSDRTIKFVRPHRRSFLPLKEERTLPPLKKYPRRFYQYYPSWEIGLPRAPAFRETNPDNVNKIVKRVCRPIQCQKNRRRDIPQEDHTDDVREETAADAGSESSRSEASRGRLTNQEWLGLLARLQKPTESSRKKEWKERKLEDERRDAWKSQVPKLPPIFAIW